MRHIKNSGAGVLVHSVNVFEVVTKLCRKGLSEDKAWGIVELRDVLQIDEIEGSILRIAVRIKLDAPDLSMGDCFCIALAEHAGGRCVTSDRRFRDAKTTATIVLFRE